MLTNDQESNSRREVVKAAVLKVLREVLPARIRLEDVDEDMELQGHLGLDSLVQVAMAFRFEQEVLIVLSQFTGDLADIQTVGHVIDAAGSVVEQSQLGVS